MEALRIVSQRQQSWRISAADNADNKQEPFVPKRRPFEWLRRAPRIRYRLPENRCPDQLLELTVLNERLLGAAPWEARRKAEYLRKRQAHWDAVYELIVKRGAAATLTHIEEACQKVETALSEQSKESKSLVDLKKELTELQKEVKEAHEVQHQSINRHQRCTALCLEIALYPIMCTPESESHPEAQSRDPIFLSGINLLNLNRMH